MSERYERPRFTAAAVQAGPIFRDEPQWFDLEATLDKAVGLIEEAGKSGARLIVFPECWLPGYPYWSLDMADVPSFMDMWAKFLWSSVEVPSRETEALCAAAKRANACVVIGINERDRKFQGRMYNSILYLNPQGEVMGIHRKICITMQERFFHTAGDGGDNLKAVFGTEIGAIGGSICGEHSQLPLIYNWIMQGVQVHCSLWPGMVALYTVSDIITRALCCIANAFGVLAATYIRDEDQPKNFYENSLFGTPGVFRGGSGIVHPSGEYVAGPVYDEEAIVYGDIDLADVDRSRFCITLPGNYSRWDLMTINVRQEPYEPVVPLETQEEVGLAQESERIKQLEAQVRQLEQQLAMLSRAGQKASGSAEY
jgi:predicted amidohydrolase